MDLSPAETRVLGCLLEKQRTTPDIYPLTLNNLRLACNQATNRDPVVSYDDDIIRDALHRLQRRGLTRLASGAGSRAPKYRHLLADQLPMGSEQQSVMTVLMLRGPQTPGELKARTERMHRFADLDALQGDLDAMVAAGLVEVLPRRPGQKEERYRQRLSSVDDGEATALRGEVAALSVPASVAPAPPTGAGESASGALAQLQRRIAELESRVAALESGRGDRQVAGGMSSAEPREAADGRDRPVATVGLREGSAADVAPDGAWAPDGVRV